MQADIVISTTNGSGVGEEAGLSRDAGQRLAYKTLVTSDEAGGGGGRAKKRPAKAGRSPSRAHRSLLADAIEQGLFVSRKGLHGVDRGSAPDRHVQLGARGERTAIRLPEGVVAGHRGRNLRGDVAAAH